MLEKDFLGRAMKNSGTNSCRFLLEIYEQTLFPAAAIHNFFDVNLTRSCAVGSFASQNSMFLTKLFYVHKTLDAQ